MAGLALLTGACGEDTPSNAVASAEGGKSSDSPSGQGEGKGDPVKYAKCMREKGIAKFPDPDSKGGMIMPEGVDPQSETFKKAEADCKEYRGADRMGGGQGGGWSTKEQVKYAECMRENGIKKFPDPDPAKGGSMLGEGSGVDPDSAQFLKADKACAQYKPQELQNGPNKGKGLGDPGAGS
ncbi:hypothetical protein G5C51_23095 [Streptomyces sp. A7024]|uniref:Uncharacterized protein n=1 Tax=Streptomyces coryli TaxID=1128680 RepID=A0A6G4U5W3_9ACTN|nr:hypothetical protein [Streptomyces coryli]NGN66778.1 hypothetical protein [Streptomyces coryli]